MPSVLLARTAILALSTLAAFSSCAQAQWVPRDLSSRSGHVMAFDAARGVAVLFGGSQYSDTWEWDGNSWTLRTMSGPSARADAAMAFDARRGIAVLFGGRVGTVASAETWEWNGAEWVLRNVPGPAARSGFGMAFDAERQVSVLFGGSTGASNLGDTWEWDGSSWTQVASTGPSARTGHALTYDSARGVTVLIGGTGAGFTWEWNGIQWMQRVPVGPTDQWQLAATFDAVQQRTVLTGGYPGTSGSWTWDGTNWTFANVLPEILYKSAMTFDTVRGKTLLFGGRTRLCQISPSQSVQPSVGKTLTWAGFGWWEHETRPWGRSRHALVYDGSRHLTMVIGGQLAIIGTGGVCYEPTPWSWNGSHWQIEFSGLQRIDHAVCFDSVRNRAVSFGGRMNYVGMSSETWEAQSGVWQLVTSSGPPARTQPAMVFDQERGVSVMFGGDGDGLVQDDRTWTWNGWLWNQYGPSGPSGRVGHAMAYDPVRHVAILFGGYVRGANTASGETWEWNGTTWTLRATEGPSPRSGHKMVYDHQRQLTLLYGGSGTVASNGLAWTWDGSSWSPLPHEEPGPLNDFGMTYDEARGVTVVVAGSTIWELGHDCNLPEFQSHPTSQFAPMGSTAAFTVAASGKDPLTFQWKRNGHPLSNTPTISGATSPTLAISSLTGFDAGWYSCTVSNPCGAITSRAAKLTIGCYANCDNSTIPPLLNIADFACFLQKFAAQDPYANCDQSTAPPTLNVADFACFLQKFAVGCP